MPTIREITDGLRFPEGPVAMADGSVVLVEIAAGEITRVAPDGSKSTIAKPGGGPNGAALGPDGRLYVCNNGGMNFHIIDGQHVPGHAHDDAPLGWVEAIDLSTGVSEVLYRDCGGVPLLAPNDLAFDAHGGFYVTDHGKSRKFSRDKGAVYYGLADGSGVRRVVAPMDGPNGVGISPDGTVLYVAETPTGRLWAFDILEPGVIDKTNGAAPWQPGRILANPNEYSLFDSLTVDGAGNVWVATIPGRVTRVSPDGADVTQFDMPDMLPTNVVFGPSGDGPAYITLSASGKLVALEP
jgi:gluconolactonase